MNLSPEWVPVLTVHGFDAVHWCTIGAASAPDWEIIAYAFQYKYARIHARLGLRHHSGSLESWRPQRHSGQDKGRFT